MNEITVAGQDIIRKSEDLWHALFIKTGTEIKLLEALKKRSMYNLEFYVPRREMRIRRQGVWHMEIKPLLPGYILVNGKLTNESITQIKRINDVYKWVANENGPLEISESEIALIRNLIKDGDVIHSSRAYFRGQKIVVVEGLLMGNEAIIKKVDKRKHRVKIALPFLGQERLIDIPVDFIDNCDASIS